MRSNVTSCSSRRSSQKDDSRSILEQPKSSLTPRGGHWLSTGEHVIPELGATHTRGSVLDQKNGAAVKGVEFETLRPEQV